MIVILGGRAKICVEENGRERMLAVRGPGQLVGERGALQVSVRSASVIALETVQALVARTETSPPSSPTTRGCSISSNGRSGSGSPRIPPDPGSMRFRGVPADQPGPVGGPGHPLVNDHPAQYPRLLNGENCTVMLSDVVGFGARSRTDEDRRVIREALYSMTHAVLRDLPDAWSWDDRGDGLLTVVIRASRPRKSWRTCTRSCPRHSTSTTAPTRPARIQLRVAINVGPVTSDSHGRFRRGDHRGCAAGRGSAA